jgi:hypothetical protein
MQPKRQKLGRYKGWRIGDAKYVGRPSRWAEPKELTGTRAQIVRQYEERIMQMSPEEREKFTDEPALRSTTKTLADGKFPDIDRDILDEL